jgi:hypothetical protein
MKNIVIFSSDAKSTSSINSIVFEANEKGHNIFVMTSDSTELSYPIIHPDKFKKMTNVESSGQVFSQSLGVNLPFIPDWLIINRERWEPESSIIQEFKLKFNCKIGLIEPNSSMINSVESVLETKSKNRYVPFIDVFFDHSNFISTQRKNAGFTGNLVVVGNPKYDLNLNVDETQINQIKNKYNIDDTKKQILLFSLVNGSRKTLFNYFKQIVNDHPEFQFFIKPYPGEPFDPKFRSQYFPKFELDNVIPILHEPDIWSMFNICDIHIGAFSSIFHASLLLNKTVYDISREIGMRDNFEDVNPIIKSTKNGIEDNIDIWMRTFNFNSKNELITLLESNQVKSSFINNKLIWKLSDKLLFYNNTTSDYIELLRKFDDFNDGHAAQRIVEYIESN